MKRRRRRGPTTLPMHGSKEWERLEAHARLVPLRKEVANAWDTHRALTFDLLRAAEGNDAQQVRALEPRVEHTRHLHAVASAEYQAIRQQIDTANAEDIALASVRTSEQMARATWVLAAATVVLAVATVALIWATFAA